MLEESLNGQNRILNHEWVCFCCVYLKNLQLQKLLIMLQASWPSDEENDQELNLPHGLPTSLGLRLNGTTIYLSLHALCSLGSHGDSGKEAAAIKRG